MSQFKIAVNTRLLLKDKLEGIGWFAFETLKRICTQHPECQFFFIFDREPHPEFIFSGNITPVVQFPQARHPVLFYIWFNHMLPSLLNDLKPDLYLSPDGYHALPYRGKSLIVIHDLNFEHYPSDLPWCVRKYYRYYFPRFARNASRIATVSGFSKQDIQRQYGIPADKIDVVYNGCNEYYGPINQDVQEKTRQEYTQGSPYFLFIGSQHPRKNLVNLFRAFDLFKKNDDQNTRLVIAGARKWWTPEIKQAYRDMNHQNQVIFTGRRSVPELKNLLGSALALTYVSYFEGFGIPILEAFACETPVIASNCSSIPEVAGEAAIYADPFSGSSIARAMETIVTDPVLAAKLIQKGKERLTLFSWQKSADLLWASIETTLRD